MRHVCLALALILTAPTAMAAPAGLLPSLFDVAGVAAGDVLNVRAEPSADAATVGRLPPDATRVEVVERREGWGRVNVADRSGWVAMRFLAPRAEVWPAGDLPPGLACGGTEPFWGARVEGGALVIDAPDTAQRRLAVSRILGNVSQDATRAVAARGATLVMSPAACSDGMSDRAYGLRADLVVDGEGWLLSGCCTIQPR